MENIEVKVGKIVVTNRPIMLTSTGIGSCLVIVLFDPQHKIGGLAHAMLTRQKESMLEDEAKYVEAAIDEMVAKISAQGGRRENLVAKLIGGANMFPTIVSNIGHNNISIARKKLKELGIPVVGEALGGSLGRSVEFSCLTGLVTVKIKF